MGPWASHFREPPKKAFMSEQNPTVGDVWAFRQDPPAPAVIVSELAGANGFQLMSRTGRIINVSRPSLRHMWSYTGVSHTGPCSIGGCLLPSGLHFHGEWFCFSHVPRNQVLGLPGDEGSAPVISQPVNGALSHCPNCTVSRDPKAAMSVVEDMTVHRCSCRARWIALLAQGVPEDGINLGEDIQKAYGILEDEYCSPIRAFVGTTALAALRRVFREIDSANPAFVGIPLVTSFAYGSDSILLVGSPVSAQDDEAVFESRLNTYWRHKERPGVICRVFSAEEASRSDRMLQAVDWGTSSLTLTLSEAQLLRDFTLSESPTVTMAKGTTVVSFPPEYIGAAPIPLEVQVDLGSLFTKAETADNLVDKQPAPNETWWNLTSGTPIHVFGIGRTPGGLDYTRATLEGGVSIRFLTSDFVRYFSYDAIEELEIVVGGEYLRSDGVLWTVKAVLLPIITLVNEDGDEVMLRIPAFRAIHRPYVRRSALDRLLDEEDLV